MDRILTGVGTAASLALIVAATGLPWATSNLGSVHYTAGALGWLMTGIAALVLAVSLVTLRRPARLAALVLVWLSSFAAVVAGIVALDAISSANASPYGNTAYGIGSGVGVLAVVVMVLAAALRLAVAANDTETHRAEKAGRTIST
jgi:hypothetical protein